MEGITSSNRTKASELDLEVIPMFNKTICLPYSSEILSSTNSIAVDGITNASYDDLFSIEKEGIHVMSKRRPLQKKRGPTKRGKCKRIEGIR